ncbi:MAG: tautomerase family protein [Pseudomonadota bacterium]
MPLYMCNAAKGTIDDDAKSKIAADITRIHCDVTDAPPVFVHAFFLENAPHPPLKQKSVKLLGSIRAGRTDAQKQRIVDEIRQSIHAHTNLPLEDIEAVTIDTPASWVMEGGDIFPEPGEEAEWIKAHENKLASASST